MYVRMSTKLFTKKIYKIYSVLAYEQYCANILTLNLQLLYFTKKNILQLYVLTCFLKILQIASGAINLRLYRYIYIFLICPVRITSTIMNQCSIQMNVKGPCMNTYMYFSAYFYTSCNIAILKKIFTTCVDFYGHSKICICYVRRNTFLYIMKHVHVQKKCKSYVRLTYTMLFPRINLT